MKLAVFMLAGLALILILGSTPEVHADKCSDLLNELMPCLASVTGSSPPPPSQGCCDAVKKIPPQSMCQCIKSGSSNIGSGLINQDAAKAIPGECGVTGLPPNFDC
ncbi:hypothetical protein O6H91_22G032000 [Diphasiastrum complanatum]|uniref:Uncharacterized protein n=1 Tax=Diphasiastrum complanatum TaxID=34168 RepID=A0ACC2AE50_DIPCM|nr:hypothetical protein O6H91_Y080200 [Diphasiastrum complanatum]KAJ7515860.1 hypothetical protein O6H91_22G032000 [Diphasiastrum complanatum]